MKKCPFCAEEIQDAAIVCKHCGRELAPASPVAGEPQSRRGFGTTASTDVTRRVSGTTKEGDAKQTTELVARARQAYRERLLNLPLPTKDWLA